MLVRRNSSFGANDIHVSFRPCKVDELLGNETNKRIIKNDLDYKKVPHTQLFVGDPGCGKTTMARIVSLGLNCEKNGVSSDPCLKCATCVSIINESNYDIKEINVGKTGGKDHVSSVVDDLAFAPFNARYKVIIFDEAHMLTDAAKNLLLKPTEVGFKHVYFIFCTNHPEKLLTKKKGKEGDAFLSRCSVLKFNRLETDLIRALLINVCEFEGINYKEDVIDLISEESEGVPRVALISLNQVTSEGSWDIDVVRALFGLLNEEDSTEIVSLYKALNMGDFKEAVKTFESMDSSSVESIRIGVTKFFVTGLKKSKDDHARKLSRVLDVLLDPIYEQGKPGEYRWYNYMFKVTDIIKGG